MIEVTVRTEGISATITDMKAENIMEAIYVVRAALYSIGFQKESIYDAFQQMLDEEAEYEKFLEQK